MILSVVLPLLSTVFSLAALFIAKKAVATRREPRERLNRIEVEVASLEQTVETAVAALKRVTQRERMRDRRTREAEEELPAGVGQHPGESAEDWKKRVRAEIAAGRIDPRKH